MLPGLPVLAGISLSPGMANPCTPCGASDGSGWLQRRAVLKFSRHPSLPSWCGNTLRPGNGQRKRGWNAD